MAWPQPYNKTFYSGETKSFALRLPVGQTFSGVTFEARLSSREQGQVVSQVVPVVSQDGREASFFWSQAELNRLPEGQYEFGLWISDGTDTALLLKGIWEKLEWG